MGDEQQYCHYHYQPFHSSYYFDDEQYGLSASASSTGLPHRVTNNYEDVVYYRPLLPPWIVSSSVAKGAGNEIIHHRGSSAGSSSNDGSSNKRYRLDNYNNNRSHHYNGDTTAPMLTLLAQQKRQQQKQQQDEDGFLLMNDNDQGSGATTSAYYDGNGILLDRQQLMMVQPSHYQQHQPTNAIIKRDLIPAAVNNNGNNGNAIGNFDDYGRDGGLRHYYYHLDVKDVASDNNAGNGNGNGRHHVMFVDVDNSGNVCNNGNSNGNKRLPLRMNNNLNGASSSGLDNNLKSNNGDGKSSNLQHHYYYNNDTNQGGHQHQQLEHNNNNMANYERGVAVMATPATRQAPANGASSGPSPVHRQPCYYVDNNNTTYDINEDAFAYADQLRHDFRVKQTEFATYAKKLRLVDSSSAYYNVLADHLLRVQAELNELAKKMAECLADGAMHNNNTINNNNRLPIEQQRPVFNSSDFQLQQQTNANFNGSRQAQMIVANGAHRANGDLIIKKRQRPASAGACGPDHSVISAENAAADEEILKAILNEPEMAGNNFSNSAPIRTYGALQRKLLKSLDERFDAATSENSSNKTASSISQQQQQVQHCHHLNQLHQSQQQQQQQHCHYQQQQQSAPYWCSSVVTKQPQQIEQDHQNLTTSENNSNLYYCTNCHNLTEMSSAVATGGGVDTSSIYEVLNDPSRVGGVALRRVVATSPRDVFGIHHHHHQLNSNEAPKFSRISVTARYPSGEHAHQQHQPQQLNGKNNGHLNNGNHQQQQAPTIEIIEKKGELVRHQLWAPMLKERSWDDDNRRSGSPEEQQLSVRDLKRLYEEEQRMAAAAAAAKQQQQELADQLSRPRVEAHVVTVSTNNNNNNNSTDSTSTSEMALKRKGILKKYGPIVGANDGGNNLTPTRQSSNENGSRRVPQETPSARKLVADQRYKFNASRSNNQSSRDQSGDDNEQNYRHDQGEEEDEIEMEPIDDETTAKMTRPVHPATPVTAAPPSRRFNFFIQSATQIQQQQQQQLTEVDETEETSAAVDDESGKQASAVTARLLPTRSGGKRSEQSRRSEFVLVDELVQEAATKQPFIPTVLTNSVFLDADAASSYYSESSTSASATPSTSTGVSRNSSFISGSAIERTLERMEEELNPTSAITESDIEDFNEILDGTKYESERLSPAELARIDSLRSSLRSQRIDGGDDYDEEDGEEGDAVDGEEEEGEDGRRQRDAASQSISTSSSSSVAAAASERQCWPSTASDHHENDEADDASRMVVSNRAAELASQLIQQQQRASLLSSHGNEADDYYGSSMASANSGHPYRSPHHLLQQHEAYLSSSSSQSQLQLQTHRLSGQANEDNKQLQATTAAVEQQTAEATASNNDRTELNSSEQSSSSHQATLHHHQLLPSSLSSQSSRPHFDDVEGDSAQLSHHTADENATNTTGDNNDNNKDNNKDFAAAEQIDYEQQQQHGLDEYELSKKRHQHENSNSNSNSHSWKTRFGSSNNNHQRSSSPAFDGGNSEQRPLSPEEAINKLMEADSASAAGSDSPQPPKKINFSAWDARHLLRRLYAVEPSDAAAKKSAAIDAPPHVFVNMEGYLERLMQGGRQTSMLKTWRRKYVRVRDGSMYTSEKSTDSIEHYRTDQSSLAGAKISALEEPDMFTVEEQSGRWNAFRCVPEERLAWLSAFNSQTIELPDLFKYIEPLPPGSAVEQQQHHLLANNRPPSKNVLVVDIGECSLRAGLLRNQPSLPDIFWPAVGAKITPIDGNTVECRYGCDAFGPVDSEMQKVTLSQPFKMSISGEKSVTDFACLSGLLSRIVSNLNIDPSNFTILLSIPFEIGAIERSQLTATLHSMGFAKQFVSTQEPLVLYAYGCPDAVVVHIGEHISVMPVVSGCAMIGGCVTLPYGGHDLVEAFNSTLPSKHICSFSSPKEMLIVRYLAENLCYVADNYERELNACLQDRLRFQQSLDMSDCQLPDGLPTVFSSDWGRFHASERIVNPAICHDSPSLAQLIFNAIRACPIDNRRDLYRNIVLSGGPTCLPRFVDRLEADIRRLLPSNTSIQVRVNRAPFAYHAPFVGATVLAAKPEFNQLCTINPSQLSPTHPQSLRK